MKQIKLSIVCLIILVITLTSTRSAVGEIPDHNIYLPLVQNGNGLCSNAPTLISPSKGSILNTLIPKFQWDNGDVSEVTEVHFLLTLHEDDFPGNWVYWVTSYNSGFNEEHYNQTNLEPGTTYYWQVWLKCGEIESPFSSQWSFTTGSDGIIPLAPDLLFPADDTTIYTQDLPITLQWSPVIGANEYEVVISRWDSGMWLVTYDTLIAETEYTIPFSLYRNTYYQWTVLSINDYAKGSASSRQFKTYW